MMELKEDRIKQESIKEFGSEATQNEFREIAERGFWESEKILVERYFKPKTNILDIGCGSGRATIPLHQAGYSVVGVDITPEMIRVAQSVAESKNLKIDYRVGDATKLEFKDNTFDGAIFANNGWAQIPGKDNRQKALSETHRALKPGGIFILTSHERYVSLNNFIFWLTEWIKYHLLAPLGMKTEGVEYGDVFFGRKHDKTQEQFIHMAGRGEVAEQVKKAGFTLTLEKRMGDVAESDAQAMRGSLNKTFNSYKSPVFYVCSKH
ncbi:MAG: class I SAM-dependent methyltransferase [Candidatus Colwellbacteria bacterium]|nr:class I SAM-dependent methyltransferase [Candidatus Colwellbacteria bacterium]